MSWTSILLKVINDLVLQDSFALVILWFFFVRLSSRTMLVRYVRIPVTGWRSYRQSVSVCTPLHCALTPPEAELYLSAINLQDSVIVALKIVDLETFWCSSNAYCSRMSCIVAQD